ncbi:General secretion pathway protein K [Anatilimnocola aggregata]|uniref:General secretion pathway protein K n=1 Tax=Anatilimnocola aggregata TaxID=2528021 RepID=A0A517Y7D4_9BACT|nr:type II secretion system protein GspK [Anatilimnocola aggregata]QDU26151.1 General secretion pathway protein K [Anatilimnocola aggregata]
MVAKRSPVSPAQRGMILIIVLIVVMFLALGAYSFTDLMLTHQESAQLTGRQVQTRLLVDSGVEATRLFLSQSKLARLEAGGVFNNPGRFKGLTIVPDEDPRERASVAILSPNLSDEGTLAGLRNGLEDESTRLNLNTLLVLEAQQEGSATQLLMGLPGMTEEAADAILDWIDPDDESRPLGAEVDHYSGLNPAYRPKNGPLDTVEELLLVRGITPQLLFGADVNRNGTLDPHEGGSEDSSGASDRGWSAYFTLHSLENNLQENGEPRVYLNGNDVNLLYESLNAAGLPQDWVNFIIAYRQNGPNAAAGQASVPASNLTLDLSKPVRVPLVQLLDLCDARLRVTNAGQSQVIASPFTSGLGGGMGLWLPKLMDTCTINPATTIPGRININQAPAHILRGIPGMNDDIITEILSRRSYEAAADDANKRHETWIMAEGIVTLAEMRTLMPFVCAGGDVYRAQIVGYYQSGEASARAEVIFDASSSPARVLFWRDLSHLGRGYAVETLGVDFLEGGLGGAPIPGAMSTPGSGGY